MFLIQYLIGFKNLITTIELAMYSSTIANFVVGIPTKQLSTVRIFNANLMPPNTQGFNAISNKLGYCY